MTPAEAQTQIDAIDAILSGPVKVTRAGREITYDFEALERRRNRLQKYINGGQGLRVIRYNTSYSE